MQTRTSKLTLYSALAIGNIIMIASVASRLMAFSPDEEACLRPNCKCSGSGGGAQCTENWVVPGNACSSQSECKSGS